MRDGQSLDELIDELTHVMFEPNVDAKLVSKSADSDVLASSAVNFYAVSRSARSKRSTQAPQRRATRRRCRSGSIRGS